MTFHSASYFLFLPIVYLVFLLTPCNWQWLVLLAASFVFYGFLLKPVLLAVVTFVIVATWLFGRFIDTAQGKKTRYLLLWGGIAVNLSILIYFKYAAFLVQNLDAVLSWFSGNCSIDVPPVLVSIGLSFYIFQAISYLADIYFRTAKPEPHFGYFALYISFFPKLLQGPIERANDLLPQLKQKFVFNAATMRSGVLLFTFGLFKKVVLADRLAHYADKLFNHVHDYSGVSLVIGIYAYALQLYFDFSAYTDMARGTGRLFGLNLTENFNTPYLSQSVTEFWRRWHISLSRWIFEYIFEPLQMKFRNFGKTGIAVTLLITFFFAGLWHGASWTYVIFGLLHGMYLVVEFLIKPYRKRWYKWLGIEKSGWLKIWQIVVTFNLVCFANIFFRANTMADAWYMVTNLLNGAKGLGQNLILSQGKYELVLCLLSVVSFAALNPKRYENLFSQTGKTFRQVSYYYLLVLSILYLGDYGNNAFVYFAF